jgi:hypothetical protein
MAAPWLYGKDAVALAALLLLYQDARTKLGLGEKEASVGYEGKSVTFTQTDIGHIDAALADILAALNELSGQGLRRGPVYAAF